jgi:hypothetical protein
MLKTDAYSIHFIHPPPLRSLRNVTRFLTSHTPLVACYEDAVAGPVSSKEKMRFPPLTFTVFRKAWFTLWIRCVTSTFYKHPILYHHQLATNSLRFRGQCTSVRLRVCVCVCVCVCVVLVLFL